MAKYRKKPVVVEAEQFFADIVPLPFRDFGVCCYSAEGGWHVNTLEGPLHISEGDWIIMGVKGEFYPIKDLIFRETYEEVE
jgi:hypothetical protein